MQVAGSTLSVVEKVPGGGCRLMTFQDRLKKSPYIAAIMSTGMTRQRPRISPGGYQPLAWRSFEPREATGSGKGVKEEIVAKTR